MTTARTMARNHGDFFAARDTLQVQRRVLANTPDTMVSEAERQMREVTRLTVQLRETQKRLEREFS